MTGGASEVPTMKGPIHSMNYRIAFMLLLAFCFCITTSADEPQYRESFVFPLHKAHNHAPGIVELSNGDLLVSWYRGAGERKADDVAVYGARLKKESDQWSEAFLMVDTPGFPDCNTCMMVDPDQRLWLFWPVILANTWESCITQYLVSSDYEQEGCPNWDWQGSIWLKPPHFAERMLSGLEERTIELPDPDEGIASFAQHVRDTVEDKLAQRLGWQPRCKPTVLPSGRIVLPLYTDNWSVSLMALSDDGGKPGSPANHSSDMATSSRSFCVATMEP